MTQTNNTSLLDFYNLLLEAERAGVKVLGELLSQTEDQHLLDLLKKFLRDEGVNCRILIALIHDLGAEPSDKTGDFVDKVLALDSLKEQIDLLIRGQEWVARKNTKITPPLTNRIATPVHGSDQGTARRKCGYSGYLF